MTKLLRIVLFILLLLFLLRGMAFRIFVSYRSIGSRVTIQITDQKLIDKIASAIDGRRLDLDRIVDIANSISSEELSFSKNNISNDPNKVICSGAANCIGYAAMFNSIAN